MNAKEAKAKTLENLRGNEVYWHCFEAINKAIYDKKFITQVSIASFNSSYIDMVKTAQFFLIEKGYTCCVSDNTETTGCYNFVISWENA